MYQSATIGVVIPAYNEAEFIGDVIASVPKFVDRTYIVDDSSSDGTWTRICEHVEQLPPVTVEDTAELQPFAAESAESEPESLDGVERGMAEAGETIPTKGRTRDTSGEVRSKPDGGEVEPEVVPVRHATNRGRGGSVKTGYQLAVNDGMDIVAVLDGDGQMDPAILDRVIDPVVKGRADYAKGNRLVDNDHWSEMSRWRLFGNTILTVMTKVASGYWGMRDSQNGYTAISADALETIDIDALYEDYGFLNDMLIRLRVHDMTVEDVPVEAVYGDEESGIVYSSFIPRLSALLLWGFLWRLRKKPPLSNNVKHSSQRNTSE